MEKSKSELCYNGKKGDSFIFGKYEQGSRVKEDIEWIILDIEDNKAMLMSKNNLTYRKYNENVENSAFNFQKCKWINSEMRTWLNNNFYEEVFSDSEKEIICMTYITDFNENTNVECGEATNDKVFLLSINEAKLLFDNPSERIPSDGHGWFLRTPATYANPSFIGKNGEIYGDTVRENLGKNGIKDLTSLQQGVRPVIWINLMD